MEHGRRRIVGGGERMAELAWHQSITSLWMLMQLRESFTLLEKLWNGAGDGRSEGRTESTRNEKLSATLHLHTTIRGI